MGTLCCIFLTKVFVSWWGISPLEGNACLHCSQKCDCHVEIAVAAKGKVRYTTPTAQTLTKGSLLSTHPHSHQFCDHPVLQSCSARLILQETDELTRNLIPQAMWMCMLLFPQPHEKAGPTEMVSVAKHHREKALSEVGKTQALCKAQLYGVHGRNPVH